MRRLKKVVRVRKLGDPALEREDLDYWLSRPPAERVAMVDELRREFYGGPQRLQRSIRVIQRSQR